MSKEFNTWLPCYIWDAKSYAMMFIVFKTDIYIFYWMVTHGFNNELREVVRSFIPFLSTF